MLLWKALENLIGSSNLASKSKLKSAFVFTVLTLLRIPKTVNTAHVHTITAMHQAYWRASAPRSGNS